MDFKSGKVCLYIDTITGITVHKLLIKSNAVYLKKAFLVNKNLRNLNLWRELWPESNTCLEAFQIRFYHRIGYYLANLEYYRLAIGIIKFSDKVDDCLRMLIGIR